MLPLVSPGRAEEEEITRRKMYVLLTIALIGTVTVFVFVAIILKLAEQESDDEQ